MTSHVRPPLAAVGAQILQRLSEAECVFCFLDFDGTLAPLAPTPDQAQPLPGTGRLLRELAAMPGTRVAVVSGRAIADVRRFLPVPGAYYVGLHGLEVRLPGGTTELGEEVDAVRAYLPAIRTRLERFLAGRPGVLLEDKGVVLAVHYRLAAPPDVAAVRRMLAAVAAAHQAKGIPLILAPGHQVTEIRPLGANKGTAVCRLLAAHSPAALTVYIGDDHTDEDAFVRLPAEAITIRVGSPTTHTLARYRVGDPGEVHQFLTTLLEQRRRRGRAATRTSQG